jgi:hypothetical protein
MKPLNAVIVLLFTMNLSVLSAQHEEGSENTPHEEQHEFKHHAIGFSIGHTHVQSGFKDGDSKWLVLPSFGFYYAYAFNHKWYLALHNEIIVEEFVVQGSGSQGGDDHGGVDQETSVIRRGRPIAVAVVGMYKIHKHINLMLGGGMEFSEHEDFALVKIGADFPYHFGNNWELFGTLSADIMIDGYDSFSFGFGVAKLF